jgi:hypothetical protein
MIILLTWYNITGVKNSGILNNLVTTAKIMGISFDNCWSLYAGEPVKLLQHAGNDQALTGVALYSGFLVL